MDAFLAFLDHVHGTLTTTYHNTPIMLMASPQWTRPDCETISRYIFEKTKTPSLCLIHSGIATQYGLKWSNMTVVDIGFEKVDVTCIYDSRVVSHKDLGYPGGEPGQEGPRAISGGEVFTRKLQQLLKDKDFSYEMAEQLKRSHICEVLPYAPDSPHLMELPEETASSQAPVAAAAAPANPASAASATTVDGPKVIEPARQPAAPGVDDDDDVNGETKGVNEDGVLDVASIVTSGQTKEFLAKKEKEKQEKAKTRQKGKGQEAADAAANKPVRLPNSKRLKNIFHYEEIVQEDAPAHAPAPAAVPAPKQNGAPKEVEMSDAAPPAAPADGDAQPTTEEGPKKEGAEEQEKPVEKPAEEPVEPPKEQSNGDAVKIDAFLPPPDSTAVVPSEPISRRIRRDIEIGLERFTFADRAEIDRIVTTIYRAVQGIEDMYMRPSCWENLVFVGNGCRVRGLKDNIIQTLHARHLISPSTATMFTSELPSNLATPSGTGSQTPTGSFTAPPHQLPTSSSVNPLLQAATTASLGLQTAGSNAGDAPHSHHFHSQTPTSIKLAPLPTYLSEWTKNGFEEAMFLGAQVAARLAFCVHNMDAQGLESQRMMSLNRIDYKYVPPLPLSLIFLNYADMMPCYSELGPKGIRTHSMLG